MAAKRPAFAVANESVSSSSSPKSQPEPESRPQARSPEENAGRGAAAAAAVPRFPQPPPAEVGGFQARSLEERIRHRFPAAAPPAVSDAPAAADSREPPRRVWYCGIGSMMCRAALELRDLRPAETLAVELQDCRRIFTQPGGMANLVYAEGQTAPAVAHYVTDKEMKLLEGREPPSQLLRAVVLTTRPAQLAKPPLDGEVIDVYCSVHSERMDDSGVPTYRYMALMLEGAREGRMRPEAVEVLRSHAHEPRPGSEEHPYEVFPLAVPKDTLQTFKNAEEVRGRDNYAVFRRKVLRYERPDPGSGKVDKRAAFMSSFGFEGYDMTYFLSRQYYNPDFGHPERNLGNEEYWAWLEHHAVTFFLRGYEQVGWLAEVEGPFGVPTRTSSGSDSDGGGQAGSDSDDGGGGRITGTPDFFVRLSGEQQPVRRSKL